MDFSKLIYRWYAQKIGCLDSRLEAIGLFPFFFEATPPEGKFFDIDALPMINCLRNLTFVQSGEHQPENDPSAVWAEGSASRLQHAIIKAHITSAYKDDEQTASKLRSSWSSITISSELYMCSVLGLSNLEEPVRWELYERILLILARDLRRTFVRDMEKFESQNMWLWKAFIGAHSLTSHQLYSHNTRFKILEDSFNGFIWSWSHACNVLTWAETRDRLFRVIWCKADEAHAEKLWNKAVQSPLISKPI